MRRSVLVLSMSLVAALVSMGTQVQASVIPTEATSIKVLNEDLFIGVQGDSTASYVEMIVEAARTTDSQLWVFVPQLDGTYSIQNVHSNHYADVWGWSQDEGAQVYQGILWGSEGNQNANQKWHAINVGGSAWQFRADHSGKYLAVNVNNRVVQSATAGTFTFGYLPPTEPYDPEVSPDQGNGTFGTPVDVGGGVYTINNVELSFKAGPDPDEVYAVNPKIHSHNVYLNYLLPGNATMLLVANLPQESLEDPLQSLVLADAEPPIILQPGTTYEWQVEMVMKDPDENPYPAGDPNNIWGPVWTFTTASPQPEIGAVSPRMQAVDEGDSAVFTATGLALEDWYQWYRKADPTDIQLVDGAKYSGVTTDTLTILDAGLADEGQYYCVVGNDAGTANNSETAGSLLMRRLMIHYPLDEIIDGKTPDVVSGYDMTLMKLPASNNLPSLVDGVPELGDGNMGLFFNNVAAADPNAWGQWATAGDVDIEDMGDGMTIAFWVNQYDRAVGTYHSYLSRRVTFAAANMMWHLEFLRGQGVQFARSGATNPGRVNYPNEEWQYLVVTVDKDTSTAKVYRNGVLQRTQTPWTFGTGTHAELKMGVNRAVLPTTFEQPFYGVLDDVRIYNYARSAEQVAKDYLTAIGSDEYICSPDWPAAMYDFNNDCMVDLADFVLVAEEWLKSNRVYADADEL